MFDATRKERIELEWIDEYARRGRRELERLGRKAEEVARRVPPPLLEAGLRSLPGGAAVYAAQALLKKPQGPGGDGGARQEPRRKSAPTVAPRAERRAARTQTSQISASPSVLERLNENPLARDLAGYVTRTQMQKLGALRGVVNTVDGLIESAPLFSFAVNPLLTMAGPNRDAALEQVAGLAIAGSNYFQTRRDDPGRILDDVKSGFEDWRVKHDPAATPKADTVLGEVVRNAPIGLNQGEFGFDVLSAFYGGAELKGLQQLSKWSKMSKAERVAMHQRDELSSQFAENFALPYAGEGHHFAPKRIFESPKIPEPVKKVLKERFMDSKWNILKPEGLDKGLMNKLHYFVDPHFYGGNTPKWVPERGWSGGRLGWDKAEDRFARIWHGRPTAQRKAGVGTVGMGLLGDIGEWLVFDDEAPAAL